MAALVHAADIQDRGRVPAVPAVPAEAQNRFSWRRHIFADDGYAGAKLRRSLTKIGDGIVEIIMRSDTATGFESPPRRWVVERTFAALGRSRRLAKDW